MKTTIDLPDDLFHKVKVIAAQRRTTLKALVCSGLEKVVASDEVENVRQSSISRLKKGFHLGGKPLTRQQVHERD